MPRGKDTLVATGIYLTDSGKYRIVVFAHGKLHPQTVPATVTDPTTGIERTLTLKELKDQRQAWEADCKRGIARAAKPAMPDTFAADVQRYLRTIKALTTIKTRTRHMGLWTSIFGHMHRKAITSQMIREQRDKWMVEGPRMVQSRPAPGERSRWISVAEPLGASEINHRLRALENFFTVIDGKKADNPAREVPEVDGPEREPKGLLDGVLDAIFAQLPDHGRGRNFTLGSKTKARLLVMRWAGLAPAHLKRVKEGDIDFTVGTLFRRPRAKGRTGKERKGQTIPLLPQAVEALRLFHALECYGTFSTSSMYKTFVLAAGKAGYPEVTPYWLRHTFATDTVNAVKDEALAQELLGHASRVTTRTYTEGAVNPLIEAAFARFKAARTPAPTPAPAPATLAGDTSRSR